MVNNTEYLPPLTDSNGYFCLSLDLQPVNNQSKTYIIIASFEDTSYQPFNCTAWAVTLDGQVYAECTTVHCGLKPSTNYAIVTVEPQATQITADEDMTVSQANETTTQSSAQVPPQKTPEEMQKEAEQSGWFWVRDEFTWDYPWYRMHYVLNVPLPPYGTIYVDYGWSALPFGMSFQANATVLALILNDIGSKIATDLILGLAMGYVVQRVAAGLAGKTLVGVIGAIALYTLYSLTSAGVMYVASGNEPKAWLGAFLSSAIGCFMDLILQGLEGVWQWLTAISRRILDEISHTLNSMWARGLNFFDITGIAFTFMDFALMVTYLALYKQSVG
jgi:hypothetical protein